MDSREVKKKVVTDCNRFKWEMLIRVQLVGPVSVKDMHIREQYQPHFGWVLWAIAKGQLSAWQPIFLRGAVLANDNILINKVLSWSR